MCRLFFCLLLASLSARGDNVGGAILGDNIIDAHVKPTLHDGFDRTGLYIIGAGVAVTALAQTYDYSMRATWRNHQRMSAQTARVGDIFGTGIPGIAIALTQILGADPEAGTAHAEALIDSFLVTSFLKFSSGRARPSSDNHQSMPSGHTSTTFASATSLTYFYGWKAGVPGYLLAGLTAASRWSDDAHWFSDTVAGAFVGFFWARASALHHLNRTFGGGRLTPFADTQSLGILWRWDY
jgi:membrane-associated phospholipid phosphatase